MSISTRFLQIGTAAAVALASVASIDPTPGTATLAYTLEPLSDEALAHRAQQRRAA